LRKPLLFLLSALVIGSVAWRLHEESYSMRQLAEDWTRASWSLVGLSFLLLVANVGLETVKWRSAVRRLYPEVSYAEALRAVLRGGALALVTPNRLGEYAGRVFSLPEGRRVEAAVATFVCRLAQLGATLAFGVAGLLWLAANNTGPDYIVYGLLSPLLLLTSSLSVFLLQPLIFRSMGQRLLRSRRGGRFHAALRTVLKALLQTPAALVRRLLGLSLLRWLVFTAQYLLLLSAFGANGGLIDLAALIAVIFLIKSFIPSIALAELGIREHIAMSVLAWILVPSAAAFHATLLLYLMNIVLPGLIGALLLYRLRLPWTTNAR